MTGSPRSHPAGAATWGSEPGQALRAVVGNLHTRDFLQGAVRMRGVADQLRGIPIDLIEIRAIRRDPVVGRATGHGSVERPGGAVSRNLRARRVLRDFQAAIVDVEGADVAVT